MKNNNSKALCNKKIISLLLIIAMGASCFSQITIHADKASQQEIVQNVLEDYFRDFLTTIQKDSKKEYTRKDFASVNGYIIAKNLVFKRESYLIHSEGIQSVDLIETEIQKISKKGKNLKVTAYVKYTYSWGNRPEDKTTAGCLYYVTLKKTSSLYKVTDLNNKSVETRMVKGAIKDAQGTKNKYQQIDDYYDKLLQNVKDMETE